MLIQSLGSLKHLLLFIEKIIKKINNIEFKITVLTTLVIVNFVNNCGQFMGK